MSDAEYQMNNWYHFVWLSGDQIVEQAVHNLDTMNWVMGANPVAAFGSGGRFTRPDDSELWDSFSIDYEYPEGRMAAYTGQRVTWKFITEESQLDLFPKDLTWTSALPQQAPAVPGKTKLA